MRRLRILKRPRNSASRHRQRRSEREKDQEDSDDRHEKPQLASRDRRGTRRRRDDGGLFVAGRPREVHRRRPLADTNERHCALARIRAFASMSPSDPKQTSLASWNSGPIQLFVRYLLKVEAINPG